MPLAIAQRDKLYLTGFLLVAGLLLFLGRNLLQSSVLITWGLTFGGTTAVVVLMAALYRVRLELQASRHQLARREAELSFAHEVQRALFPRALPSGGGLEFSAVCIPARGISGDYYDVMDLPDGRLVFVVADISGKGISAAILMANLQAVLRTQVEAGRAPAEVCARLNHHLHQVTDAAKFATFFYAEWDRVERRLQYVNAGHQPPVIVGSNGGKTLDCGGYPLGVFPQTEYETGEVCLRPGDVLVLYSDGISEAANRSGELFGDSRLASLIEGNRDKPPGELQREILEAVRKWAGSEPQDDQTLLIVRAVEGYGAESSRSAEMG